jgi:hypothetical protein
MAAIMSEIQKSIEQGQVVSGAELALRVIGVAMPFKL